MIHFRSCPRCNGDMQVSSDVYGTFKSCLQCGNQMHLEANRPPRMMKRPLIVRPAEWHVA